MVVYKQLFTCCLLIALSYTSGSDVSNEAAHVNQAFNNNNVKATIAPIAGATHTIMIGISNYGETSNDVSVEVDLPQYAKRVSSCMHFEELTNMEKNSNIKETHEVPQQTNDGSAFNANPTQNLDDNAIQSASNTVVMANEKMTFDFQLKETIRNTVNPCLIDPNNANITLDLYGTTVKDMVGELYSPNYPEPYPNNADITWLVRAPEGHAVRLNLVDLNIEECCDRLTVYDGNSIHGKVLAVLTGTWNHFSTTILQSTGNSLFLHLTSDCLEPASGFNATVEAFDICSGDLLETECCAKTSGDGLYTLASGEQVYCSDGWVIFQRRMDGSITDFHTKTWQEYALGFGNLHGEFWLGLRKINQITEQSGCRLRVDLQSFDEDTAYEEYSQFSVADEANLFRINVGGSSGTAGDSLTWYGQPNYVRNINGMAFSTNERDNDRCPDNCATEHYAGGWWHNCCFDAAPNGIYGETRPGGYATRWYTFKEDDPMKFIQMGVRCD